MTKILIRCPACANQEFIELPEGNVQDFKRGLLAVNIPKGTTCSHSFIAYIDKNMKIRDYFIADFEVEIPELQIPEKHKDVPVADKDLTFLNSVKINFSAIMITHIVRSIFLKKKILLISEDQFLNNNFSNFLKVIYQNSFTYDISFLGEEEYKAKKKDYKEFMVFHGNEILNNANKAINSKKLSVEKHLIKNFISELDLNSSLSKLKKEIQKAHFLSESIIELINQEYKDGKINILRISKTLQDKHNIKINNLYLEFLIDIVRGYFEIKIPSIFESFQDLL
jgi:hypothetical protein